MPRIGEQGDKPREKCPDCGGKAKVLTADDFPSESTEGVNQAMSDGATLLGCVDCSKRWAVIKAPGKPKVEAPVSAKSNPGTRHQRRAQDVAFARAIRANLKLAGSPFPTSEGLPPLPTKDERRKARNARKGGS